MQTKNKKSEEAEDDDDEEEIPHIGNISFFVGKKNENMR